ncbi:hypothetical protein HPP92_008985 [Vanilla planifolia]|uniref:Uncharacterized protein n=1 Tax=Vanilla planifolia TaxID=51239 RepID=A0A835R7D2_VANPL|nr:hypothetical protein HPP92_008985 [Vanilla planifolia]
MEEGRDPSKPTTIKKPTRARCRQSATDAEAAKATELSILLNSARGGRRQKNSSRSVLLCVLSVLFLFLCSPAGLPAGLCTLCTLCSYQP